MGLMFGMQGMALRVSVFGIFLPRSLRMVLMRISRREQYLTMIQ